MESDCCKYVKKCHKCQIYADKIHVPLTLLNVISSPWPFSMWGIDMIGMIEPKASNGHRFILVAIYYFTKWVEAASYAYVIKQNLNNKMMKDLFDDFKIEHNNSSPYRPKKNWVVEAANKNIKKIIQKMVVSYKYWHEMLPFSLHVYRTFVFTSTGTTSFSLVYGMESVLPVELYQKRMKKAFDKKVGTRVFREGDLVLKKILSFNTDSRGKWTPNCEGACVVKRDFSSGSLILITMDGKELPRPLNDDIIRKYFT
ncbi:hypothetical protein KIW84_070063 [Lathyrus oleraceus]|uniref:Uncharacterized protein n=1 Tax=Pisum sativum TaxID=3888 RepID=A0A9D4ZTW2_PEA|nr:hypothetical protein KIW84_070063 [Pisum sativum]